MVGESLKILNLSSAIPAALGDGSAATFATIAAMCHEGAEIHYAYLNFGLSAEDLDFKSRLTDACEGRLKIVPLSAASEQTRMVEYLKRYGVRHPQHACRYAWARLRGRDQDCQALRRLALLQTPFRVQTLSAIENLLSQDHYDLVQVDYPAMVHIVRNLPRSLPWVFVAHELQHTLVRQLTGSDHMSRLVAHVEASEMRQYDAVLTLSPDDESEVRANLGCPNVHYSPLTAPAIIEKVALRTPVVEPALFTFLGGHAHAPNADGVAWLCRAIIPGLLRAIPNLTLRIIGRYPADFVAVHQSQHVKFEGFVEDVTSALEGSIFLCPIRLGSGMRIKILDAVAAGAPIISTTIGARGLGLAEAKAVLIADDESAFVQQAHLLVHHPARRAAMAQLARKIAQREFGSVPVARRRLAILRKVATAFLKLRQGAR